MILVRISTGSLSMRIALEAAASGADGSVRGVRGAAACYVGLEKVADASSPRSALLSRAPKQTVYIERMIILALECKKKGIEDFISK